MSQWGYSVLFEFTSEQQSPQFDLEAGSVQLHIEHSRQPIRLNAYSGPLSNTNAFHIHSDAVFASQEESLAAGEPIARALKLIGVYWACGLWTDVYARTEEQTIPKPLPGKVTGKVHKKLSEFKDCLVKFIPPVSRMEEKHEVAVQIYNDTCFLKSSEARLVALTGALEILAGSVPRSDSAIALISELQTTVGDSGLNSADKERLKSALGNLKSESKRVTVATYVENYFPEQVSRVDDIYRLRNKLAHGAVLSDDMECHRVVFDLGNIVRNVIWTEVSAL